MATHEVFVLTLDTLPLLIGIAVYTWYWPGKYLTPETKIENLSALQAAQEGHGENVSHGQMDMTSTGLGKEGQGVTGIHDYTRTSEGGLAPGEIVAEDRSSGKNSLT